MSLVTPVEHDQMILLCDSFPCLQGRPGTLPWDQEKFAKWLRCGASHGEKLAGRFVMEVWNHGYEKNPWWKQPQFNVVEAFLVWDHAQKSAYIAWCQNPFFP